MHNTCSYVARSFGIWLRRRDVALLPKLKLSLKQKTSTFNISRQRTYPLYQPRGSKMVLPICSTKTFTYLKKTVPFHQVPSTKDPTKLSVVVDDEFEQIKNTVDSLELLVISDYEQHHYDFTIDDKKGIPMYKEFYESPVMIK